MVTNLGHCMAARALCACTYPIGIPVMYDGRTAYEMGLLTGWVFYSWRLSLWRIPLGATPIFKHLQSTNGIQLEKYIQNPANLYAYQALKLLMMWPFLSLDYKQAFCVVQRPCAVRDTIFAAQIVWSRARMEIIRVKNLGNFTWSLLSINLLDNTWLLRECWHWMRVIRNWKDFMIFQLYAI